MASKEPFQSCLAVLVCTVAIVLGIYLIIDGIRHPAFGADCGWILWDSNFVHSVECDMQGMCIGGWTQRHPLLPSEGFDSKEACEAKAKQSELMWEREIEAKREAAQRAGKTTYTRLQREHYPQCWPVGYNPSQ